MTSKTYQLVFADAKQLLLQFADAGSFEVWRAVACKNISHQVMCGDPLDIKMPQLSAIDLLGVALKAFDNTCSLVFTRNSTLFTQESVVVDTVERVSMLAAKMLEIYIRDIDIVTDEERCRFFCELTESGRHH